MSFVFSAHLTLLLALFLASGSAAQTYYGTSGNDNFTGTSNPDTFFLIAGADSASGKGSYDDMYGGTGNDFLAGQQGNDWIYGEDGSDDIYAGDGADHMYAGCNPGCATGIDQFYDFGGSDVVGAENGKYDEGNVDPGYDDVCYLDYPGLDAFAGCDFIY